MPSPPPPLPTPTSTSTTPPAERPRTILTTPRLLLRTHLPTDAPLLAHLANNPLISATLRDRFPSPYTLADAEAFIGEQTTRPWPPCYAICLRAGGGDTTASNQGSRDDDSSQDNQDSQDNSSQDNNSPKYIGGIGLNPQTDIESHNMEVGYWLGADYWGRGYMTELLPAFLRFTFDEFPDVWRVDGGCFSENPASRRVLERSGFTYEGTRRGAVVKRGKVMDLHLFGFLRSELSKLEEGGEETEKEVGDGS